MQHDPNLKDRTMRLRLCEESQEALNMLKAIYPTSASTIINTLLINAVKGQPAHEQENID